jgi:DNA-binding NtrC family response regulator
VRTFCSGHDVWRCMQRELPSCMVLDLDLPGFSGLELQQRLTKANLSIPIIFLTGKGDIPTSVRAIKAGAVEFLTKPVAEESLLQAIEESLEPKQSASEEINSSVKGSEIKPNHPPPGKRSETTPLEEIVGRSSSLMAVLAQSDKVAPLNSTVLITGETGTGKELLARAIHHRSRRSSGPFVAVNCGAIPQSLIASELFGHEKGAFTGALQRRLGRFELAGGGTIFLDEIGELPPEMQVMLLRVLQERTFERVGGSEVLSANVRVIAATHQDLQAAISAGKFRSDLFYRLNVFPLEIPSLRERREDIPLLAGYFVDRFSHLTGQVIKGIDPKSMKLLQAYWWPGNIRELQNVIERSVITCESELLSINESYLPNKIIVPETKTPLLANAIVVQEKGIIEQALRECKGRVSGHWGAAAKLGVPPSTLESKILSLKIDKHRFKSVLPDEAAAVA